MLLLLTSKPARGLVNVRPDDPVGQIHVVHELGPGHETGHRTWDADRVQGVQGEAFCADRQPAQH